MFKKIITLISFTLTISILAFTLTNQFNVATANHNYSVKYTKKQIRKIRHANLDKIRELNIQRYQIYNRLQHGNDKQTKYEINRLSHEINKISSHLNKPYIY